MNRYNIRIDGEVMPNSFTYEELLLNDIFDFDDIEVKEITQTNWNKINLFSFPEERNEARPSNDNYYIAEDGQVHFKKRKECNSYTIDEFGQVVNRNNIYGDSNSNSTSRNSTFNPLDISTKSSSNNDNTGWKRFLTIVIIILFIIITGITGWGSIPAGIIGYWVIKKIWNDDH